MKQIIAYIAGVRAELYKVEWPKRQEVVRLTLVVISISALIGVYVGVLDFGLTKLLELLVKV